MGHSLSDVERSLEKGGLAPVILLQGSERLLVDKALGLTLEKAVGDRHDAMAITRLDLADSGCDARIILGHCQSLGLFATRGAVVLRSAELLDKKTADRDALAAYAASPNRDMVLILVAEKLKASTRLVKGIKKAGALFSFERLRSREVPSWIMSHARALGQDIDPAAAHLVAELVGADLLQLSLVIDHLSLFAGKGQAITLSTVETCLCATRHHSIFELVDAVGEGKHALALGHLQSMLDHREPPLRILAMLIRHFRLLWQVWAGRAGGESQDSMIRSLKLHPFQGKKFWNQSRRFSEAQLTRSYERLFDADLQLKSSTFDAPIVLERVVLALCGARAKSRRVS